MKQLLITIAAVVLVGCGPSVDIWIAAKEGNIKAVKQHLAAGADVNAKTGDGWSPLIYATYYGHKEIIELLIAAGADANVKDSFGGNLLHYAASRGRKEVAELLVTAGTEVNGKNKYGLTPLNRAATRGHKETAELLIANGADCLLYTSPSPRDQRGSRMPSSA